MIADIPSSVFSAIKTASAFAGRSSGLPDQAREPEKDVLAAKSRNNGASSKTGGAELSDADSRQIEELKTTDRAVRAHEAAHIAAGGSLVTSGATYSYETGPDGQRYAVAGEVGIDTSKGRTPEETLIRAQQIHAAALAPTDPSPQDRSVAATATRMATEARAEIARVNMENNSSDDSRQSAPARGFSFGEMIEQSLSPNGQGVNIYA